MSSSARVPPAADRPAGARVRLASRAVGGLLATTALAEVLLVPGWLAPGWPPALLLVLPLLAALAVALREPHRARWVLAVAFAALALALWLWPTAGSAPVRSPVPPLAATLAALGLAASLAGDRGVAAARALGGALVVLATLAAGVAMQDVPGHPLPVGASLVLASLVLGAGLVAAGLPGRPQPLAKACAALLGGLGLLVIAGWLLPSPAIVQGGTRLVPMQFNTAACALLSSIALSLLLAGRHRIALAAMVPVAVIAVGSLLEEYAGVALGVGEWLVRHGIVAEGVVPGRMAPNTATAFVIATLGVLAAPSAPGQGVARWAVTWSAGFMVSAIAAIVLSAYAFDLPGVRGWGSQTPMALMTALGLLLLGLSLGFAGAAQRGEGRHRSVWVPLLVALAAIALSLLLWSQFDRDQALRDRQALERQAESVRQAIDVGIGERRSALSRMGERLGSQTEPGQRERLFRRDSSLYLRDFRHLAAIAWTDADGVVQAVNARGGALPAAVGERLDIEPVHAAVFERVRRTDAAQWSGSVVLYNGRPGALLVAPGHDAGFLMAAVEFEPLFEDFIRRNGPTNALRVRDGERVLYSRGEPGPGTPRTLGLHSLEDRLEVDVWRVGGGRSLAYLLLFGGLVTGGLLALALRLAALAGARAELAEANGRRLREQIEEAERARAALGAAEREFAQVFESISDAFYVLDREWRFVLVNPRAEQLMRQDRDHLLGRTVWECFPDTLGTVVEDAFRAAMGGQGTQQFEIHFAPLGRWFDARVFPHPNGIAVYFQDVSDRRRAEEGQRKAQAASVRAQQLAQLGSWEYDLASGELAWSEETFRIFGLAPAAHAPALATLAERVHFEDRPRVREAQARLHAGDGDIDLEYRILRPDGDTRVVRELGTLLRDAEGRPLAAIGSIQDITDRRAAEDRLREMARRLEQSLVMNRQVMEHSLDVICALDANGRFLQASTASLAAWGHAPGELVGRAWIDLVHPDDRGLALRTAAAAMAGQAINDLRLRCVRKDGQVRVVQWSLGWSAQDRMSFAVARDVTELDRQSRALEEAKTSLQRAQQVARMGAWELDLASGRLSWSEEALAIFGLSRDQFGGDARAFLERVHPEDLAAVRAAEAAVLSGQQDMDLEHRILLPDGSIGHVHERARLLRNDQGQPWLISGSVQDISERKRAEAALEKERGFLRTLLESLSDGVVACDAEGRLTLFNRATRELHGLPARPLPAEQWASHYQLYAADGETPLAMEQVPLFRALRGEVVDEVEMVIAPVDRPRRIVLCSGQQILAADGRLLGAVVAMHDITHRKASERFEAGQRDVLAGIASRQPMPDSLAAIARLCEAQLPGALSSVLLLDDSGRRVLNGAAPSLPADYSLAIHGLPIGPRAGSCGTAAWRGEPVVVGDIATDPLWEDYRDIALAHGLRACWSVPVKSSEGRVLATFATYYRQPRLPSEPELRLVSGMASLAAVAIEQARAYESLAIGEQRFRSLFDEHPDAVYSLDREGRFTSVNAHFSEISGASAEDVVGQPFEPMVAPEDVDVVRGHFQAAARGEARSYEMTGVRPDGARVELRISNLPIVVDGRVTGVFGIAQDIRLLRKHQRELAAALDTAENSSRQLRRLSDSAIQINRRLTDSNLFQYVADALRSTVGAHQALISLNIRETFAQHIHAVSLSEKYARWKDFDAPSDGSGIYAIVGESNRPVRMTQAELEAHPRWRGFGAHAAGHPPMRGWLAVPLIGGDGRNIGQLQLSDKLHGEFTQDDELVAVQFAQMASTAIERARLIEKLNVRDRFFEMTAEIFVIFDPARRRFVEVNPMLSVISGYDRAELTSREFTEFVHPDDRDRAEGRAGDLLAGEGVIKDFSVRYVRKDGQVRWIEWLSSPAADGLVYAVGRDVTERRKAEEVLRQTMTDLDARNRELQDFAFIASHDLQEPLRKIRAFSDRLLQRHAAQLADEARDYLGRTSQAAARMQTLIDDLLAYSRVSARGKPFARVDLGAVLAAVTEDLEARLESSGGRIEAGPLPTIEADPTQMRQLLQNLLANALKFRDPARAPRVRVEAAPVRVEGQDDWELRIEDNGIGFEPRHAEKVFAPFQRLHGRQDYEGTGIGLAIVRRIVERHRGSVRAEGRPGEGASFVVVLPAAQPASPQPASLGPAPMG